MKTITITFSRSYDVKVEDAQKFAAYQNTTLEDAAARLARIDFGSEYEMLDETSDNFSSKVSIHASAPATT